MEPSPDTSNLDIRITDKDLPVLSIVATKAMRLISRGEATADELGCLILKDQALTSRILRVANSPVYGSLVKISTIEKAIVRLGMTQLKNTILVAATGELFDHGVTHIRRFWDHAMSVALVSHLLSEETGVGDPAECFVAGMLHDVGKAIIFLQAPEAYGAIIERADEAGIRFHRYEKKCLTYCSHESVGALVGLKWQLGREVVEPIRFHHDIEVEGSLHAESEALVALVSTANLLVHHLESDGASESVNPRGSKPARIIEVDDQMLDRYSQELPALIEEQRMALGA